MPYLVKQIPENNDLYLSCSFLDGCGKHVRYSREEAIRLFGDMEMDDLRRRARCTACGHVGASTTLVFIGKRGAR